MNTDKILQVENLTKTYGREGIKTQALWSISFDVLAGEFLGIMGPSGSGKTTLLNSIATMIRPTSGKFEKNRYSVTSISSFEAPEQEIFRILLEQYPCVVSKHDISLALWGGEEYVNENILQVNMTRLRKNLDIIGRRNVIKTVRGQGYFLEVINT